MATNVYSPLDRSAQTIRLIEIQPGDNFPIACRFYTYELADCPPFVALSYTWGPRAPVADITVDGEFFPIRENLWSALYSIRAQDFDEDGIAQRLLWIDAISIDQSNVQERNHQVNLMKQIYSQADFVLTWLGPSTESSSLAFQTIHHIIGSAQPPSNETLQNLLTLRVENALLNLFQNPYWTRVWIVQEILLPEQVVIMCGGTICQWDAIAEFFRQLRLISLSNTSTTVHALLDPILTSPANHIFANWDIWISQEERSYKLAELLTMWPDQECEDPRDRVFGFLGLLSQRPELLFSADYAMTPIEVFRHVLTHVDNVGFQETENARSGFAANLRHNLVLDSKDTAVDTIFTAFEMKGSLQKAISRRVQLSERQWEACVMNYFRKCDTCAKSWDMADRNSCRRPENIRRLVEIILGETMLLDAGSVLKPMDEYCPLRGPKDDGFTSTADTARLLEVLAGPNTVGPNVNRIAMEATRIPISDRPDQDRLPNEGGATLANPRMSNSVTSSGNAGHLTRNIHLPTALFPSIADTNIQRYTDQQLFQELERRGFRYPTGNHYPNGEIATTAPTFRTTLVVPRMDGSRSR